MKKDTLQKVVKTFDLSPKEISDISQILKDGFGKSYNKDALLQKYSANPYGFSYHGLSIDQESSRICGVSSFSPRLFRYQNHNLRALQILDTCFPYPGVVSPYSIKNIVFKTVDYAGSDLHKIDFIYGFPNQKIERLWVKLLKWEKICTFYPTIVLPILSFASTLTKHGTDSACKSNMQLLNIEKDFKCRLETSFHSVASFPKRMNYLWINKSRSVPVQICAEAFKPNAKSSRLSLMLILHILRLFIPSVRYQKDDNVKTGFSFTIKSKPYPLYILAFSSTFSKNHISDFASVLWSDSP